MKWDKAKSQVDNLKIIKLYKNPSHQNLMSGVFHHKNCYRFQNVVEFMFYFMYNNNMYVGGKRYDKVMAVNAGSSSLKFQLFNMPSEKSLLQVLLKEWNG